MTCHPSSGDVGKCPVKSHRSESLILNGDISLIEFLDQSAIRDVFSEFETRPWIIHSAMTKYFESRPDTEWVKFGGGDAEWELSFSKDSYSFRCGDLLGSGPIDKSACGLDHPPGLYYRIDRLNIGGMIYLFDTYLQQALAEIELVISSYGELEFDCGLIVREVDRRVILEYNGEKMREYKYVI